MIFNDDVRRLRRGSQFGHIHINRDIAEDHAKIMRDYFAPTLPIRRSTFANDKRDMPENFWHITNRTPVEPEDDTNRILTFLEVHRKIESRQVRTQLQQNLVEHHWQRLSES
ncbi:hypothetical protein ACQJBY_000061 [Aegilops geniculata]